MPTFQNLSKCSIPRRAAGLRFTCCLGLFVIVHLSLAPAVAQEDTLQPRLDRLCEQLEEQRQELHIPGMAIAIVKDDKVVLSRGFGLRDLENKKPVTDDTLFAIGSTSKAFTAALIGMLVDDGKMSWDDKVSSHIPYFKLKDGTANENATIRDLLCHRVGLTRMGMLWAGNNVDRERILRQVAHAEPLSTFRASFNYNNVMYLAAGVASAKAAGAKDWDALLKTRILDPLNMHRSHTDATRFPADPNASQGYYWDDDKREHVNPPMRNLHGIAPAGAINSNVRDMAQWLRLQLAGGEYKGKRLISRESLEEMRTPQVTMSEALTYGLGWMLHKWKGHRVVQHNGSIDGFGAALGLLPDDNIGFVLLTNVTATPLQDSVRDLVWEAMLGDYHPGKSVVQEPRLGTPMSLAELGPYLGRYRLDRLGVDATVQIRDDKLAVDIPGQMTFTMKWPDERGRWVFDYTADIEVAFAEPVNGIVPSMSLHQKFKVDLPRTDENDAKTDVSKLPGAGQAWSAERLAPLLGSFRFERGNVDFEISVKDSRLQFIKAGGPMKTFEWPGENGRWTIKGSDDRSMEFIFDEDGKVTSAVLHRIVTTDMPRMNAAVGIDVTVSDLLKLRSHSTNALPASGKLQFTGTVDFVRQGVSGKFTEIIDGPDRYMLHIDLSPFGYIKTVVDGDTGWVDSNIDVTREAEGKELELMRQLHRLSRFGDWQASYQSVEIIKADELNGEKVYVVLCTSKVAPAIKRYVSAKTGLVLKDDWVAIANGIGSIPITMQYFEYRDTHGIQMPTRSVVETSFNDRLILKYDVVESDFSIPPNTFKRPKSLR